MKNRLFLPLFALLIFCSLHSRAQDLAAVPNQLIAQLNVSVPAKNFPDYVKVKDTISRSMKIYLLEKISGDFLEKEFHELKKLPFVAVLQYNHRVQSRSIVPNDSFFNMQWNFQNTGQSGGVVGADISATQAWEINHSNITQQGDSIVIAIIDVPMDLYHEDLNYFINYNEIDSNDIDDDGNGYIDDYRGWDAVNNIPLQITTIYDHSTHVAGIAAAKGNNGIGISGVCWGAKILPVSGSTNDEAVVLRAYDYVIEMRKLYDQTNGAKGAFVIATNSSFGVDNGLPANFPIWCALYDSLGKAGILSATATANNNTDIDVVSDIPTACPSDYMIAVTGTTRTDVKGASMAYGATTIDIAAPGSQIYSTIPENLGGYGVKTGCSMASPHIAGAVASMFATACPALLENYFAFPDSFALVFKNYLLNGVDTLPSLRGKVVTNGRLNLLKTLQNVQSYDCCDFGFDATITQPVCGDSASGSIVLTSDSTLSFRWSSGDTTAEISGKNAGIYIVTASGGTCSLVRSFYLEEPNNPIVVDSIINPSTCWGQNQEIFVYAHSSNDALEYAFYLSDIDGYKDTIAFQSSSHVVIDWWQRQFEILIRNQSGCMIDTTILSNQIICVGINELTQNSIRFYPNPAQNQLTVSLSDFENGMSYSVFDINGRLEKMAVFTEKITSISTENLANGVYVLEVINARNQRYRVRFSVMR